MSVLCIRCGEIMKGIESTKIREVCSDCGGFSKVDEKTTPRSDEELHQFINKYPPRRTTMTGSL